MKFWSRLQRRIRPMTAFAGRSLTVLNDDVMLVSYPRSGNTWARFLLGNLLQPSAAVTFRSVHDIIPDIYMTSDSSLSRRSTPRILKSHEYFDARYPRVIYLVRDPRDVAASYRRYLVRQGNIEPGMPEETFVRAFVDGALDTFGSWREHVSGWITARRGHDDFLWVRYEDLLEDTQFWLSRMADIAHLEANEAELSAAVQRSAIDNMKEMDLLRTVKSIPGVPRPDIPFIDKAKAGTGREELGKSSLALIEDRFGDVMASLGYDV